jgi:hypothetical protein
MKWTTRDNIRRNGFKEDTSAEDRSSSPITARTQFRTNDEPFDARQAASSLFHVAQSTQCHRMQFRSRSTSIAVGIQMETCHDKTWPSVTCSSTDVRRCEKGFSVWSSTRNRLPMYPLPEVLSSSFSDSAQKICLQSLGKCVLLSLSHASTRSDISSTTL